MNTYLATLIVLVLLFFITTLTALYLRKYDNPNLTIAFYVSMIAVIQIITNRLTIFDFSIGGLSFTNNWQLVSPIGTFFFAFTFQMTDQINEKYGRKEVQKMIIIALVTQIFIFFILWLVSLQPQINDNFDAESYNAIMFGGSRIIIASWITFYISENVDAYIFEWFKNKFEGKLWLRNSFSDIVGLFIDSIIFIPLAFYSPGGDLAFLLMAMKGQVIVKWIFGTIDTPYVYLNRWIMKTDNSFVNKLTIKKLVVAYN